MSEERWGVVNPHIGLVSHFSADLRTKRELKISLALIPSMNDPDQMALSELRSQLI